MKRTILALTIAGLLATSGAAVAAPGGATSAQRGDGEQALTRPVVATGTCKGGAHYRATMENATFTDESGTRPSVYVTVVVRQAGASRRWGASGTESYRDYDGTRETMAFEYRTFRSGLNGVITFDTNIPGNAWHRYEIDARRTDGSQRCLLSLRA